MTEIFPPFSSESIAADYLHHFAIKRIREGTVVDPEVVVSTSLYWGITYFHEALPELALDTLFKHMAPRKALSWWNAYMKPLLLGCFSALPEKWQRRIYLSADLEFLTDIFPEHVTIVVMAEKSPTSMPAMLWRYMPLLEPVLCVARGADNFHVPEWYIKQVQLMQEMKADLLRLSFEMDLAYQSKYHYRPICGSCVVRGPVPFMENATSWLRTTKEALDSLQCHYNGLEHTAMYRWDAFGQDEQFLCRWLYYYVAHKGGTVLTEARDKEGTFVKDAAYLQQCGVTHHVFP